MRGSSAQARCLLRGVPERHLANRAHQAPPRCLPSLPARADASGVPDAHPMCARATSPIAIPSFVLSRHHRQHRLPWSSGYGTSPGAGSRPPVRGKSPAQLRCLFLRCPRATPGHRRHRGTSASLPPPPSAGTAARHPPTGHQTDNITPTFHFLYYSSYNYYHYSHLQLHLHGIHLGYQLSLIRSHL